MHSSVLQGVLVRDATHEKQVQSDVQEDRGHLERCSGQTAKQSGQFFAEVPVVQDLKFN